MIDNYFGDVFKYGLSAKICKIAHKDLYMELCTTIKRVRKAGYKGVIL